MKLHSTSFLVIVAILFTLPTIGMTGCSDKSDNPTTIDPPPSYPSYDILATWLPSGNGIVFLGSEPTFEDSSSGLMLYSFEDGSATMLLPGVAPFSIAITSDERWVSLQLIDGIYNWNMENDSSFKLPLPSDAYNVDFSPDGRLIAYDVPVCPAEVCSFRTSKQGKGEDSGQKPVNQAGLWMESDLPYRVSSLKGAMIRN